MPLSAILSFLRRFPALRKADERDALKKLNTLHSRIRKTIATMSEREQLLTERNEEQKLLLDNIDLQVWFLRAPDLYGAVNQAHAEFMGPDKAFLERHRLTDFLPPEEANRFACHNATVFRFREPVSFSSFQQDARGRARILSIRMTPRLSPGGAVEYAICTAEDITKRIAAEQRLRRSEERFRGMFESIRDVYYRTELNGLITLISPSAEALLGYAPGEMTGHLSTEFWADPREFETFRELLLARSDIRDATILLRHKNGQIIPTSMSCRLELGPDGEPAGTSGVLRDISERVSIEERLRASLKEKEVMLTEIHHRVKNNLQVISSLLQLQSSQAGDPQLEALFAESQNRILSMAYVHEELYKSGDLAHINLKDYVQRLARRLVQALAHTRPIGLELALQDIQVTIDQAVPCGLILNELISNALEHAFEGRAQGRIIVSISLDHGLARLMVSDDGKGVPADFDPASSTSLGLQLVVRLARQLRGRVELDSQTKPGASFSVEFPLQAKP
ncbi:signal transduction histidine kinase [Desulfocurvibacter africanus subsp. africanus str. Walvis Bay]|uniref:histidine kinase n=2 Tax=Desulfocurvibacter africanus TaxID=873 RepID=F3YYP7_DESAF|nr:signal transduction histidine kinase [Desulfocurvibacter africanus subsp. africanus str. Walvis Bay]